MTMHLIVALLACGSVGLEDGTLLALEDSNKVVAQYTGGEITHVAVIVNIDGRPWVYEATPAKVRRVPLATYYQEIGRVNAERQEDIAVWIHRPRRVYAPAQRACMKAFLERQLGRRYSVKKYVRGGTGDGIHCAELAAMTLTSSGRMDFPKPSRENPQSLIDKVRRWYDPPALVAIKEPTPTESWCSRSWQAWNHFFAWWRWAGYESWTWCWP